MIVVATLDARPLDGVSLLLATELADHQMTATSAGTSGATATDSAKS